MRRGRRHGNSLPHNQILEQKRASSYVNPHWHIQPLTHLREHTCTHSLAETCMKLHLVPVELKMCTLRLLFSLAHHSQCLILTSQKDSKPDAVTLFGVRERKLKYGYFLLNVCLNTYPGYMWAGESIGALLHSARGFLPHRAAMYAYSDCTIIY